MKQRLVTLLLALAISACDFMPAETETTTQTSSVDMENNETTPTLGIINELHPAPGLITGGQPSTAQLETAARTVRTVINLRAEGEEAVDTEPAQVEGLGMSYISIPVSGAAGVTEANARLLDRALSTGGPTLLHCGSGNRVGALLALRAFHIGGASPTEALAEGRAGGLTSLEQAVSAHLEAACADPAQADQCD